MKKDKLYASKVALLHGEGEGVVEVVSDADLFIVLLRDLLRLTI